MTLSALGQRPLVMGVINVTPDSFSGDGVLTGTDYIGTALRLAGGMIGDGADILDIGGESSRPGATPVLAEEEIRRTAPVIKAIKKKWPGIFLSIDTNKAKVAEAATDAGALIINDISAMRADAGMASLAAARGVHVVLMHNRGDARAVAKNAVVGGEFKAPDYGDIVEDVANDLAASIEAAQKAGIKPDKIIADPGLGFGKTVEQNCALINRIDRLKDRLGCPVLIGPSRKSFIGRALDQPVDARLEGTAAAVAIGIARGADIVRVHDVGFMARIARMAAVIARSGL